MVEIFCTENSIKINKRHMLREPENAPGYAREISRLEGVLRNLKNQLAEESRKVGSGQSSHSNRS